MRLNRILLGVGLVLTAVCASGQGTFVFDQQSSSDETPLPGSGGAMQQILSPWGQSFTAALSSIDFLRLKFNDGNTVDGLGATIYINLRAGSISGTIVSTTSPVAMGNGFAGVTTFLFPSSVPLSAGTTYYFEPILQSGGTWNIEAGEYNYPGGSLFANGLPVTASDLWFREGIIVPEPSSFALLVIGGCSLLWLRNRRKAWLD